MQATTLIDAAQAIGRASWPAFLVLFALLVPLAGLVASRASPSAAPSRTRIAAWLLMSLAAGSTFAWLAVCVMNTGALQGLDEALLRGLASDTPASVQKAFAPLTRLGEPALMWAIGIVIGAVLLVRRRMDLVLVWSAGLLGNAGLDRAFKSLVHRARPLIDGAPGPEHSFSFPSGHAAGAAMVCGLAAWLCWRLPAPKWRVPVTMLSAALILTVAFSRLFLQVHFLSDVLGSIFMALAWASLCIAVYEAMRMRHAAIRMPT